MEQAVGDPSITHVLMLLDAKYVQKANLRHGGVGIETQLISPAVYGDPRQTRYVPLLFNTGDGWAGLPHYLKSRLYFDFGTDAAWETNWPALVRHLHSVESARPPLGAVPLELFQDTAQVRHVSPKAERVIPTDLPAPYGLIYDRLHQVLKWHTLDSLRAASLLAPFGFSLGVLASPSQTVAHLDEAALTFITDYFQVSRDFLLGRSREPGLCAGHWYKHPQELCQRIADLHIGDQLGTVFFIALPQSPALGDQRKKRFFPALMEPDLDLFVLLTQRRQPGEHEFYTYEVWEAGRWNYEKCRLDLKAIALFCQRLNLKRNVVFFMGGSLPDDRFKAVTRGTRHVAEFVEEGFVGLSPRWHPDDYVSDAPHLAKEIGEMPRVVECYEWYGLEGIIEAVLARSN
ncbi:hypothetical protein HNQ10_000573 [Deinococcus metallilatus]|nr:hypothetical protein [Deinococcus metallilatus]